MCVHRSVCKCIVWMLASQLCFSTHLHTTQRSGGRGRRRGWELKPESGPGPTVGSAPRSLPPAFMWSLLQKPSSRGNVSLLVCQETSMPKEGASCPDTALPVGYVRTFLPPLPPPVAPSVSFSFVCTLTRCRSAIILVQWPLPRCVCAHSTHLKLHFLNYFFYDCNIKHSHGVYVFSCTTFPFSFRDTVKTASQAPAELMEQLCFVFLFFGGFFALQLFICLLNVYTITMIFLTFHWRSAHLLIIYIDRLSSFSWLWVAFLIIYVPSECLVYLIVNNKWNTGRADCGCFIGTKKKM